MNSVRYNKIRADSASSDSAFLPWFPLSSRPDLELIRLHKPTAYFVFPYVFGCAVVALLTDTLKSWTELVSVALVLGVEAVLVRAAYTWNDIVDQDLDRKVERTRGRPMARRAISNSKAIAFLASQVLALLVLQWQFSPSSCLLYTVPNILINAIYPFTKRYTNCAQIFVAWLSIGVLSWRVPP